MSDCIDLNCDLGEGGPSDPELLDVVSSASVACGFHAGGPVLMAATVRAALQRGVTLGAHPSYDDRLGFGRRALTVAPEQLEADLVYQIGALQALARREGGEVRYLKPHGALYNQAVDDAGLAATVVRAACQPGWRLPVLSLPGSAVFGAAGRAGLACYAEGFADRAYAADRSLVPRGSPGAVLTDTAAVVAQARALAGGTVSDVTGRPLELEVSSLCIHGDTPGALAAARAVRAALEADGFTIAPFVTG
ncbi:MAG TPA: 5-oxoprolinase subunit PxpA [Acidimicrobiales bacterium]|nr:5-oxoprolinase subunit PxpA [Acidimicrobiales bacterium]